MKRKNGSEGLAKALIQVRAFSFAIALAAFAPWTTASGASTDQNAERANVCEQKWNDLVSQRQRQGAASEAMLIPWLALKSNCEGTGVYEYRLAALYNSLGRTEMAHQVVDSALQIPSNRYRHYVQTLQLSMLFQSYLKNSVRDLGKYRKIVTEMNEIVRLHPDWALGFQLLSDLHLYLGDQNDAIANAEKALAIDDTLWTAHRILVVSYATQTEYQKALPHVEKAVRLNEQLTGAPDFMSAAALTYTALGDYESAQNVITALTQRNPTVRNTPQFKRIVALLQKQLEESKAVKTPGP